VPPEIGPKSFGTFEKQAPDKVFLIGGNIKHSSLYNKRSWASKIANFNIVSDNIGIKMETGVPFQGLW